MQQRRPCCRMVRLLESLAQGGGDHGVLALGHVGQGIAGPMHATALPSGAQHPGNGGLQPFVSIGDHQLDAGEAAALEAPKEVRPEHLGFRRAEVQADDLAPAVGVDGNGDYRRDRDDPPGCANLEIGGIEPQVGHSPSSGRVRKLFTRSSMSLHSLLTEDLEIPVMPIAWTSSSTRRVETPPIQASWMTDTSAFSTVRRGSRKPGKYDPCRSFGMRRVSEPSRVSNVRSR